MDLSKFQGTASADRQTYTIEVDRNVRTYDLNELSDSFDLTRAKFQPWGYQITGSMLTIGSLDLETIKYDYDIQHGDEKMDVTLKIKYYTTFEVSFDANGGTGDMTAQRVREGEQYVLPTCTFTAPTNQEFKTWEIDGKEVAPGAEITVDQDTVAKAVWGKTQVTVTYDANGGSGTMEGEALDKGGTYKLPDNAFSAPDENQEFKGWQIGETEHAVGDEITVNEDTVVKALWKDKEPETVTVTFHANGHGTAPKAVTVKKGETVQEPTAPSVDGYLFGGWYTESACENRYAFTTPVTEDITLYAKWTQEDTTPPAEIYTITIDPSGGNWNGETDIRQYPVKIGSIFVLDEAPAREGYTFLYWKGSKYDPGDRYRVTGNHTFTAVWKQNDDKEQDKPEPTELRKTQTIEIFKRLQRSNDKAPTIPRAGVGA